MTLWLCVGRNFSTSICLVWDFSLKRKVESVFNSKGEAEETHNVHFYMTCRFKNDTFGCQAFVLSELLKFTVEFKARSSLHARMHSVTCKLKRCGSGLPASSFLMKCSRRRRTTERVQQKTAKEKEPLPDLPLCQLSAKVRKRPVALGISALHWRSSELFVTADFNASVWKPWKK